MFEDFFDDLDIKQMGITLGLWAFCLIVLGRFMYDPKFIPIQIKVIISIVMLPIIYLILHIMRNK